MIFAVLGAWILMIALKYWRLKKGILDILWAGVITVLYGLVFYETLPVSTDPNWLIYGGALGTLLFFNLGSVIKGKDDSLTQQTLEKKYDTLVRESENLRHRFLGTLDVLEDGLIFKDHQGGLFLTGPALKLMQLSDSEMSEDDYYNKLHPDDQPALKEIRNKAQKSQKKYHTKYRIKVGNQWIWIEETGLCLRVDKQPMSIMQIRGAEVRLFPKTTVDVLNYLPKETDLDALLLSLHPHENPYTVVAMRLSNIPGINAKYGRDVGDMLMGEFLKKMKYHFIKQDAIFRLQGILFIMVIQDDRKADMLQKALQEDSSLLQTTIDMGGVRESVYPYFGFVRVSTFNTHALEIKGIAIDALRLSLHEDVQENFTIQEV